MELPVNTFKRALAQGRAQIGLWSTLAAPYALEAIAGAGYDWILIDTEHSPADLENVLAQLQAAAPYPSASVVRVPWNDMVAIKRVLDVGAQSLLVPYVQTAAEASNAVAYTRYPPAGVRGVSAVTRATRFGRIPAYAKRAHEEICVLVQIETAPGLENLEAIAAVDGVDGVFIGPGDLHASLGYAGETSNPKVMPLIDDAIRRIRKAGKAPGILTGVEEHAKHWLSLGAQFVAVGTDTVILARESEKLLAKFRD
ncbi:MAG: HpcH/HpaI aldolase/citrate lyase family protein [Burkholderiales bacterium]|nr:HpcH/HpaI aldolase/citrate lyase family protein [Burkholderiales bacterium]